MPRPFFTIGHSTRSFDDFVALLNAHDIKLVVDVRAVPKSRTNPQYNSKEFSEALSEFQVGYQHIAALGGLRGRMRVCRRRPTHSGRTRVFTIMQTTRRATSSDRA
jgi:uncharacterized protein (DUF488 family)